MNLSLDIETTCAAPQCDGYIHKVDGKGKPKKEQCRHALDHYKNRITIIGIYYEVEGQPHKRTFRNVDELRIFLSTFQSYRLVGANLKFDLNLLHAKGLTIPMELWGDDVVVAATVLTDKIPEEWLEKYAAERKRLNDLLPSGVEHRNVGKHSLKTLAPFHLGVTWFWEDPSNHDSSEYVLNDCEYAYRLVPVLTEKLKAEGSYEFYREKMLPWAKLLTKVERRGISIDMAELERQDAEARNKEVSAKVALDEAWAPAYAAWIEMRHVEVDNEYAAMLEAAVAKLAPEKREGRIDQLAAKYGALCEKSKVKNVLPLNLNSPDQMTWLLRDHLGLDIENFDGEESTGAEVLLRLAGEGRADIQHFLDYRQNRKLLSSFYPTYRAMHNNGIIRASFHYDTARTGRLSSSDPNLQQVPGDLHKIFIPRTPNHKFIIKDQEAIEPKLIGFYTEDAKLCELLLQGKDFHGNNAKVFFDLETDVSLIKKQHPFERSVAKEAGLSILYGSGGQRLQSTAQNFGVSWSLNECYYKVNRFREEYREVIEFHNNINDTLYDHPVKNLLGRQFRIANRRDIYMKGFNTLIQGSASDLVLHSAMRAQDEYERLGLDAHVVLLVHDEIVVEAHETIVKQAEAILDHCMTDYDLTTKYGRIKLKVEGSIAERWEK